MILPFPGGVASSGSKAGSRYKFTIASTYAEYCPTLRDKLGDKSRLPAGRDVGPGDHHQRPGPADDRAGDAGRHRARRSRRRACSTISAGNYGGRLGKSFIYLHPEKQPA